MEPYSNSKTIIKHPNPNTSILIVAILSILYTLHHLINTYIFHNEIHDLTFVMGILNIIQTFVSTSCIVGTYIILYLYIRNFQYKVAEYLSLAIIFIYIINIPLSSILNFHYTSTSYYMIHSIAYAITHIALGISLIFSKRKIDYVGKLYIIGIVILVSYIGKVLSSAIIVPLFTTNSESFDVYHTAILTSNFFFSILLMISVFIVLLEAKKYNRNEILANFI